MCAFTNNVETVQDTYKNLKHFVSADYSNSEWYFTLKDDFEDNDDGKKGYLTRDDIETTLEEYFNLKGVDATDELKDEYLKKIDRENKGQVTFEDLYLFAKQAVEIDFLPELEEQCKQYNINVWTV